MQARQTAIANFQSSAHVTCKTCCHSGEINVRYEELAKPNTLQTKNLCKLGMF